MTASSNGDVKSIPVRCLIEVRNGDRCSADDGNSQPETETFAIVPSNSLFKDVVRTVLLKLGYSIHEAASATGAVQIKNWRALDLEQVTDDELVSVEDMLGDLANVATLRIKIARKAGSEDVKDKLLLLLLRQSFELLSSKGCPISKDDLEMVAEGRGEFSARSQAEFYMWYKSGSFMTQDVTMSDASEKAVANVTNSFTPMMSTSKTRLRISFSPEEVAKLQQWFEVEPHPSRLAMTRYLTELNNWPGRGASFKPIELSNIVYWFKNARAAARRNGRSVTSEDHSDDEECSDAASPTSNTLPDSNPLVMTGEMVKNTENQARPVADDAAEESDNFEDLSVSEESDNIDDGEAYQPTNKHIMDDTMREEDAIKPDSQPCHTTSCSSPKSNTNIINSVAHRLPGYPFPYGAFPMAYLQSQINPFYKDWSEKVQSVVAQATAANTAQQNAPLLKPESIKAECELSKAERQKRHRAFIDPVSEIPKLEQWFTKDTHPSHFVIEQICDDLNRGEFRSRYPKLSPKNIQLWFKNHRAKVKRMRVGGGNLSFNGMESAQIKPTHSPRSGISLSMLEGV